MDNYNSHGPRRRRVTRQVLRRRQFAALAVIAFVVLLFFILIAKGCSKSDDDKKPAAKKPVSTTTSAVVTTTVPATTATEAVTTENPKASNVKLSTREIFVDIGERDVAIIQSYPDDQTGEANEVWKSMDDSIATVDKFGYITGVSKGQTFIVLSFSNHPDIEIEIKVSVADDGKVTTAAGDTPAATTAATAAPAAAATTTTAPANAGLAALPERELLL